MSVSAGEDGKAKIDAPVAHITADDKRPTPPAKVADKEGVQIVFPLPAFAFIVHKRELNDKGEIAIKEEADYKPFEVQFLKSQEDGEP